MIRQVDGLVDHDIFPIQSSSSADRYRRILLVRLFLVGSQLDPGLAEIHSYDRAAKVDLLRWDVQPHVHTRPDSVGGNGNPATAGADFLHMAAQGDRLHMQNGLPSAAFSRT